MKGSRSLTPEEAERVRRAISQLAKRYGSQAALAQKLGVGQQQISKILRGVQPPGVGIATSVAKLLGTSYEELRDGRAETQGPAPVALRALPGWEAAATEAKKVSPSKAGTIDALGSVVAPILWQEVTSDWVLKAVFLWEGVLATAPAQTDALRKDIQAPKTTGEKSKG